MEEDRWNDGHPKSKPYQLHLRREGDAIHVIPEMEKAGPAVQWRLWLDLSTFPSLELIRFLTFIAPSARTISLALTAHHDRGRSNVQNEMLYDGLLSSLKSWEQGELKMHLLEELSIEAEGVVNEAPFREAGVKLIREIVREAMNLKVFSTNFPYEEGDGVMEVLTKSLTCLRLGITRFPETSNLPYKLLTDSGFRQLTELEDHHYDMVGLVEFLTLQKESLETFKIDELEKVYDGQLEGTFPQLQGVKRLECQVTCNSTFEFLTPFPNLIYLSISVQELEFGVAERVEEHLSNLTDKPRHPNVEELVIYCYEDVAELISFPILAHCFPHLTRLTTPVSKSVDNLRAICAQFTTLEWLHLQLERDDTRPYERETVLSGLPSRGCDAMKARDNFDDAMILRFGGIVAPGLANLKRLQTLMLSDPDGHYNYIFTKVTIHRVFMRMESLKEIVIQGHCGQTELPWLTKPFVEPLRAKGVDIILSTRK